MEQLCTDSVNFFLSLSILNPQCSPSTRPHSHSVTIQGPPLFENRTLGERDLRRVLELGKVTRSPAAPMTPHFI